jgi:hypothetical protein
MPGSSKFAVYAPPTAELPFLAVMITVGGIVSADAFANAGLAEAHNLRIQSRILDLKSTAGFGIG